MKLPKCKCIISSFLLIKIQSIYTVHDDVKDKEFELELSWICAESNFEHQMVPKQIQEEAEKHAKAALEEGMNDDE